MIFIGVVAHENEFSLFFDDPVWTLHGHIDKKWDKLFALYIAIFILIELLEYLVKIEAFFFRELAFDLFCLLFHKYLILQELRQFLLN